MDALAQELASNTRHAKAGERYGAIIVAEPCGVDSDDAPFLELRCITHQSVKWHGHGSFRSREPHVVAAWCRRCHRFEQAERGGEVATHG